MADQLVLLTGSLVVGDLVMAQLLIEDAATEIRHSGEGVLVVTLAGLDAVDTPGVRLLEALSDRFRHEGIEVLVDAPQTSLAGGVLSLMDHRLALRGRSA